MFPDANLWIGRRGITGAERHSLPARRTGMRRRALLTGAGVALLTGCSRGPHAGVGGTGTPVATPVATPASMPSGAPSPSSAGRLPVASWGLVGGFLAPQYVAIRPYRLAVYPDGLAVADARYRLALSGADRDALVAGL